MRYLFLLVLGQCALCGPAQPLEKPLVLGNIGVSSSLKNTLFATGVSWNRGQRAFSYELGAAYCRRLGARYTEVKAGNHLYYLLFERINLLQGQAVVHTAPLKGVDAFVGILPLLHWGSYKGTKILPRETGFGLGQVVGVRHLSEGGIAIKCSGEFFPRQLFPERHFSVSLTLQLPLNR